MTLPRTAAYALALPMLRRLAVSALFVLLLAAAFAGGYLAHRDGLLPLRWFSQEAPSAGESASRVWQKMRRRPAALDERQEVSEAVASLPYLQGYEKARAEGGVIRIDEAAAFAGFNLYNSGHAPEAALVDMRGRLLHRWGLRFAEAFPDRRVEAENEEYATYWRRVHLLPDGGLLAIYQLLGLVRLDAASRLVFRHEGGFHHDLAVQEDGTILVLEGTWKRLPRISRKEKVLEDFVTWLSPDGEVRDRLSLLEAFEDSDYAPLLQDMKPRGDIFHTNALKILDGTLSDRLPAFRRGNLLISLRELDTVAVVNPKTRRVEWALSGLFQAQHEPVLLPTGRMLVFDNLGRGGESRVIELDPLTQEIHWQYAGSTEEPFASWKVGVQQRLPNGNTLITESTAGRAIEVTPGGQVVWEFLNPARAGRKRELIATLYEMRRFGPELGAQGWLRRER